MTRDAAGHDKLAPSLAPDVDPDRRDSNARLRIQAEVSHAFAGVVTDYRRLIETIVRTAADLLGDGCQIFLVSDDGLSLVNAGNAHRDPAVEADIRNFLPALPSRWPRARWSAPR